MAVILDLTLPAEQFELGRILRMSDEASIDLETMVPLGERTVPFFRYHDGVPTAFEESVDDQEAVTDIHVVSSKNGETLFAIEWDVSGDSFFNGLQANSAHLLSATGSRDTWQFELRFPSHDAVSDFQAYCKDNALPIEVEHLYNPTKPDVGPWFGLTPAQREMLARAVESGYYSIPRGISTKELADEFDISDQAVTERLRRAIIALTTNTLLVSSHSN